MKNYEILATKIMINALEGVKAQIRKAYDRGYEDGKAATPFTDTEKEIMDFCEIMGYSFNELIEVLKEMRGTENDE